MKVDGELHKLQMIKKNLFGYGSYDNTPYESSFEFTDYSEGIETVAKSLVKYYLNPSGTKIYDGETAAGWYYNGPTLSGVNTRYATDQDWHKKYIVIWNYYIIDFNSTLLEGSLHEKINFKIKNVRLAFTLLIILAFIVLLLYYHFVLSPSFFAKSNFTNQMIEIADENENLFSVFKKILLYSSANAINNLKDQSLKKTWVFVNIQIYQFILIIVNLVQN